MATLTLSQLNARRTGKSVALLGPRPATKSPRARRVKISPILRTDLLRARIKTEIKVLEGDLLEARRVRPKTPVPLTLQITTSQLVSTIPFMTSTPQRDITGRITHYWSDFGQLLDGRAKAARYLKKPSAFPDLKETSTGWYSGLARETLAIIEQRLEHARQYDKVVSEADADIKMIAYKAHILTCKLKSLAYRMIYSTPKSLDDLHTQSLLVTEYADDAAFSRQIPLRIAELIGASQTTSEVAA